MSLEGGYCHPDDFKLAPFTAEAVRLLNQRGWRVVVVTNQSGVADGRFTLAQLHTCFEAMTQELARAGAWLEAIYFCPHSPTASVEAYRRDCEHKKPAPGMLLRAAEDLGLKLEECFMIGDMGYSDMQAGARAGCRNILVRTGHGATSLGRYRQDWAAVEPDYIAANLLEAARWIAGQGQGGLPVSGARTRIVSL